MPNILSEIHVLLVLWCRGQVYESCSGNPEWNARVQIGRMSAYFWSKSKGYWVRVMDRSFLEGKAYRWAKIK